MTTHTAPELRPPLPYRGRRVLWGVVVPLTVLASAFLLVLSWLPQLPEEVAVHWGPQDVNRYGSVWELVGVLGAVAALSISVLAGFALFTGRTAFIRRMVLGLATGQAVLFAGLMLAPVAVQLDLAPGEVPDAPELGMLIGLAAALAAGALAAGLAGKDPRMPATGPVTGAQAELAPDERAVWVKTVSPSRRFLAWFTVIAVLYLVSMGALAWSVQSWFTLVLTLLPLPLTLAMFAWRIRVDSRGLTAASFIGWPRLHVPADEVEGAAAARVESPMGEFGGWGIRSSLTEPGGAVGVVIRSGEALEVDRSGGRKVVVTIDDAATAAALLNTKAQRARQSSSAE